MKRRWLEIRLKCSNVSSRAREVNKCAGLTSRRSVPFANLRKDEIENFSREHHLDLDWICEIVRGQHLYTGSGLIGIAGVLESKPI